MPATWAAVGAISSIAGGIFGATQADQQNRQAREGQEAQQKLLNEQAKLQNEYNQRKFEADKENYRKQVEYNFETAVKNWQYNMTLRALEEKTNAQQYLMNIENSQKQLTFNEIAAQQAQSREQLALNDAKAEYRFNAQDQLVAQLQAQGKARLGQAGRSMQKRVQSSEAQIGRDLAVMSASLTGEINASHLRMFDINMGKYAANANVEAARMLRPGRLPDIPAPTKPPEPTWVEPMKILPGMAPPAAQQSTMMPLIEGFGSAATSLASVDWKSGNTGKLPAPLPGGGGNTAGYITQQNTQFGGQTFSYKSPTSYTPNYSFGGLT
jgi:hypothetical protein